MFITFSAIGSPNIVLSNMHQRYVTWECCFIIIWLYLIFSWRVFFDLRLLSKRINLSTNQSQVFQKSLLNCFSTSSSPLCWYKMHESSACKNKIHLTACPISLTLIKNEGGPKINLCGTPQEIFPKSESLLSGLIRNIWSGR